MTNPEFVTAMKLSSFFPALNDASFFIFFSDGFCRCLLYVFFFRYLWHIWVPVYFDDCKEYLAVT